MDILDICDAERFVFAWGFYERGRLGGLGQAIEMVEKLLCRGGVTAEQREVLSDYTTRSLRPKRSRAR
jgi:hypothetical protein